MAYVPGFDFDLFVSYAHRNDEPFNKGLNGWVTEFVEDLRKLLEARSAEFGVWSDPNLRMGEVYTEGISRAIAGSAVFLCVLSPAYNNSAYCKKEVNEFREQRNPSFGMTVGKLSRMQAIMIDELPKDRWPPELYNTTPHSFFSKEFPLFFKPDWPSETSGYYQGLWTARDSIWALLEEMRKQKETGTAIPRSYDVPASQTGEAAAVYLAEVSDDLYNKRESLRTALLQSTKFRVQTLSGIQVPSGSAAFSIHLFGNFPGRPAEGQLFSLPRLQLEAALAAKPVRRPVVWLARDLKIEEAETPEHRCFLESFLNNNGIELLRTGFEDLKTEIQARMRPRGAMVKTRRARRDSIVHIWHLTGKERLDALKRYLRSKECGISVFPCDIAELEKLQAKLDSVDGVIVSYTAETQASAVDIVTRAFYLRNGKEKPLAFAPVEYQPPAGGDFNFEHPRVVPVQVTPNGDFPGIDQFLQLLENDGAETENA